jgi:hypothetical protein
MMHSEAQNVKRYQTVGISRTRHKYLRYFILTSNLLQQCHSSGACSVCFEKRVVLHMCDYEATRTREKPTFCVGNSPRLASEANEHDGARCAGCRSGAATPLFSVRIPARSGVMSTVKAKINVFISESVGSPDLRHAKVLRIKYFMFLGSLLECDVTEFCGRLYSFRKIVMPSFSGRGSLGNFHSSNLVFCS